MKVAFFTEAGSKRGMGHLIRCQTIANEFRKNAWIVDFYLDSDIDYSYKYRELKSFFWNKFDLKINYDLVFIDSYEASKEIYELVSCSSKGVFIDDFERLDYPAGVIINFAPRAKDLFFKNRKSNSLYLLGLEYLPFREIFDRYKKDEENKLFIMLGGNDIKDLSEDVIDSLEKINIKKLVITSNIDTHTILKNKYNVLSLYKPSDEELIKEMSTSSYAITTASMSVYELAYYSIPTVILAVSKNQIEGVSQLIEYNIADEFVNIENNNWKNKLEREIVKLLMKKKKKEKNVDLDGCSRIYKNIVKWINK